MIFKRRRFQELQNEKIFLLLAFCAACSNNDGYVNKQVDEWPDNVLKNRCSIPSLYLQMKPEEFSEIKRRGIGKNCITPETYERKKAEYQKNLQTKAELSSKRPSDWSSDARKRFRALNWRGQCNHIKKFEDTDNTKEFRVLASNLGSSGLLRRDVELIVDSDADFGTSMSYFGMKCQGAHTVNTSFYPGLGHTWQMQLGDSYVYLEGNGKENGMRVKSWN